MTRFEINHDKDPNAACNDGSTPVFFMRRGYGSGTNKWIVFLQGGDDCYDDATCAARGPGEISSKPWAQHDLDKPGFLSDQPAQNPDFYSWNEVYVPYCSSDFWTGTRADNNNSMKFYFRGRYILDGIVDSLSDASIVGTPTLHDATNIIFAGASAGGVGVRANLDRLAKTLSWADVRGMMDALFVVPTNPAWTQEDQDQRGQVQVALWKSSLDESCLASSATRPWLCMGYAYALMNKEISTPLFVRQDLYDPLNIEWQSIDPKNPQDRPYISAAALQYTQILKALPGAFGTATGEHTIAETDKFNSEKVDGLTFAQVLGNWYFNRSGPKVVVAPLRNN